MTDIVHAVAGWRTLVLAAMALGVLPGVILRVIVRLFPRADPRRRELQAELYAVPWWERPFWVAQTLEVAVFEGLGSRATAVLSLLARRAIVVTFRSQAIQRHLLEAIDNVPLEERLRWALAECISAARERWHLHSGVELNRAYPQSFWIPSADERELVRPGDVVKLTFEADEFCERMWVTVKKRRRRTLVGTLSSVPIGIPRLGHGDRIKFMVDHIIDIDIDACDGSE